MAYGQNEERYRRVSLVDPSEGFFNIPDLPQGGSGVPGRPGQGSPSSFGIGRGQLGRSDPAFRKPINGVSAIPFENAMTGMDYGRHFDFSQPTEGPLPPSEGIPFSDEGEVVSWEEALRRAVNEPDQSSQKGFAPEKSSPDPISPGAGDFGATSPALGEESPVTWDSLNKQLEESPGVLDKVERFFHGWPNSERGF